MFLDDIHQTTPFNGPEVLDRREDSSYSATMKELKETTWQPELEESGKRSLDIPVDEQLLQESPRAAVLLLEKARSQRLNLPEPREKQELANAARTLEELQARCSTLLQGFNLPSPTLSENSKKFLAKQGKDFLQPGIFDVLGDLAEFAFTLYLAYKARNPDS